jgi:hypothetical protein
MVSYWKTQWFRFSLGCIFLIFTFYYILQPAADESTLEGLSQSLKIGYTSLCYFINAIIWFVASYIGYNNDRIKLLEKKAKKYDALCKEVHELYEANKIDREYQKRLERKINLLEDTKNEEHA